MRCVLLAALPLLAFSSISVSADDDMVALTDEPSRGELFLLTKPEGDRALAKDFAFPKDTHFEAPSTPRKDAHFGIDISHHNEGRCNCIIDWTTMRGQNVVFVYLKATQGAKFYDKTFARHWTSIGVLPAQQKLYRGAYHFLSSDIDPVTQAKHFLKVMPKLTESDLPPCLDLEWDMRKGADGKTTDTWSKVKARDIADRALTWLREVKRATGRTPIIYTNKGWWAEHVGEDRLTAFADYPIWLADYSASGLATERPKNLKNKPWLIWQFTENAKLAINGKPSQVDANIFKGDFSQFKAKLGVKD